MENTFDIHKWQAKFLKESRIQEGGGYIEVMGPRFDEAIEAIQLAWEEWKDGPMTEPQDIPQAKQDILDYISSLLQ